MFADVMLELTYRCNLKCAFCYLLRSGRLNKEGRELKTEEVFRLVKRFKAGTGFYLTGGEPLMRADIFAIMARIKKAGSRFGLNTNGTLLDAAGARRLAGLEPDYVIFSLHGSEAVHDRLTGRKGAWRALMTNMRRFASLARPRTEIIATCVVNRDNAGQLLEVYRYASSAGAHRVLFEHLQFLTPGEAAGVSAGLRAGGIITPVLENYRADAALMRRQFDAIRRVKDGSAHFETRPLMTGSDLALYYNGEIKPEGSCARALNTLNVEPDGGVRLCVLYGLKAGHALKTGLKKILAFKKKEFRTVQNRTGQYISSLMPLSGVERSDTIQRSDETGDGLSAGCARCCHRFGIFRHF